MQETFLFQYVGTVYFRQQLRVEEGNWIERSITISSYGGNDKKMVSHRNWKTGDREETAHSNQDKENPADDACEAERFRCAIWRGDYRTFHKLIEKTILDAPDQFGRRPLHLAAERTHKPMVEDLLLLKVDLNARCDHGQTALHRAAWGGSTAIVKLLQNRVDETAKDKDGNTALHIAAQLGLSSVTKLLIKKSAIDVKGYKNLTPLHLAAISGHITVVELLEGANIEAKDNKIGWTPLHCAADYGDQNIVKLLIERGAEVNIQDDRVG
jgi:ankyrin repeat protein